MKAILRLLCLGMATFCVITGAVPLWGQHHQFDGIGGEPAVQSVMAELPVALPGRVWFATNLADRGLGYTGSYFTLGGKTRLFEDFLDGRWLLEGRSHVSMRSGGFFGNLGVERVFTIKPAGADVSLSGWFDYDSDHEGNFSHAFQQLGVSGEIRTRAWDIYGNGYFPIGTRTRTQGDPFGQECFFNNVIVLQAGIDSALEGFDAGFRYRPAMLGLVNGSFELGGYGYSSDVVDFFGGIRARVGMQAMRGVRVLAEVNHDDRFDLTGVLQLSIHFGTNARGNEYAGLGRDLEPTIRNDHVVRFRREALLAIDPATGLPYTVWHVNNTANPAIADGTAQRPFAFLKDAEAASSPREIIFVHVGDGTTQNYDQGIVLQDHQLFLGSGAQHVIPIQGNRFFELCVEPGPRPRISGFDNGPAIRLANNNTVRGFIIDGARGDTGFGIVASTPGETLTNGIIEDVDILDVLVDGISMNNIAGDWRFARLFIDGSGRDGIFIQNAIDPTSNFQFEDVIAQDSGRDGIAFHQYDGATFSFLRTDTSDNIRHGVFMNNHTGAGSIFRFEQHTAFANEFHGLSIVNADGDLTIIDSDIILNGTRGISLVNMTNTLAAHQTRILDNAILGNGGGAGPGIFILLDQPFGLQQVLISGNAVEQNGIGLISVVAGLGAQLDVVVVDNITWDFNFSEGMRFRSTGGGTQRVVVQGPTTISNTVIAMSFFANGTPTSLLEAVVRDINVVGTGVGMNAQVTDSGQLLLDVRNYNVLNPGLGGTFNLNNTAALNLNRILLDEFNVIWDNLPTFGTGVILNTGANTLTDFQMRNSDIIGIPDDPTNFIQYVGGNGIVINTAGANNMTRVILHNNLVERFVFEGIIVNAAGGSRLLMEMDTNFVFDNGIGPDPEIGFPPTSPTVEPYFNAVSINASTGASIHTRIVSNLIRDNWELGLVMTNDGGEIVAVMENNQIAFNGVGRPGFGEAAVGDLIVTNIAGDICLALSNNFFTDTSVLTNLQAPANFIVELDGGTNGPAPIVFAGAFTFAPYSTVCEPAIQAEEAAFDAMGFPPRGQ